MQEMRAAQAHTDLAMVTESDQIDVRIRRAAGPAFERLGGVGLGGRAGMAITRASSLSGLDRRGLAADQFVVELAEAGHLAAAASAQPGTERSASISQPAAATGAGRTRRFLKSVAIWTMTLRGRSLFEVCV
jgi:hypothetical protein